MNDSAQPILSPAPLGGVAAFIWEVRPLLRLVSHVRRRHSAGTLRQGSLKRIDSDLYEFSVPSGPVVLAISGVGRDNSHRAAQFLAENYKLRGLASIGFAGGLAPGPVPGDIVQIDAVVEESTGERFNCWTDLLPVRSARQGALLSVDAVVTASAEKLRLGKKWGAVAVDMESAGVARAAAKTGLPFCAVKAVTDSAEQSLAIDFSRCWREDKGLSTWAVVSQGLKSFRAAKGLWTLARGSQRAANALASAITSARPPVRSERTRVRLQGT